MEKFIEEIQLRWTDFDANGHIKHSSYYDFGAMSRFNCLEKAGITLQMMQQGNWGVVLLREECVFRKEIRYGDKIFVEFLLLKAKRDQSRFIIEHPITKSDGTLSALLTIDGGFFDRIGRKLIVPPQHIAEILATVPKSEKFTWMD